MKFYKTPFYRAVEKGNIEMLKLLLNNDQCSINIPYISIQYWCGLSLFISIEFKIKYFLFYFEKKFNKILKFSFKCNLKFFILTQLIF